MRDRRICLYCNSILLAILYNLQWCITDMQKDLVYHRFDLGCFHQTLDVSDQEIGNTDRFQLTSLISILKCFPCSSVSFYITVFGLVYFHPWLWGMDDHHIRIIQSHSFKCFVDTVHGFFISLMLCCNLGYHK